MHHKKTWEPHAWREDEMRSQTVSDPDPVILIHHSVDFVYECTVEKLVLILYNSLLQWKLHGAGNAANKHRRRI